MSAIPTFIKNFPYHFKSSPFFYSLLYEGSKYSSEYLHRGQCHLRAEYSLRSGLSGSSSIGINPQFGHSHKIFFKAAILISFLKTLNFFSFFHFLLKKEKKLIDAELTL